MTHAGCTDILGAMATRKKGGWCDEQLQQAFNAVKEEGMKIKPAAMKYGIPRKTLSDYMRRGTSHKRKTGPETIFAQEEELMLVARIKRLQQVGFPLTRDDIRRTAYEFGCAVGVEKRFGKSGLATKRAGRDWFDAFMARHIDLSFRSTETLSYGRGAGLNRVIVQEFYDLLAKTVANLGIQPQNMFNMDETGLQLCTRSTNVVAQKGSKRVPQMSTGEKGETVSVVACCSATGVFLPPLVIFKGIRRKEELADGLPPGTEFHMTESGYAQTETFRAFIEFICKHKPDGKSLLIMDGHRSHVDYDALSMADDNGITILLLPAHTSHELQPLDKCVFKALKSAFYSQCKTWHSTHPGRAFTKLTFHHVFTPAWNKAATRENAISGFVSTGIYPLNQHAISDSAFGPADVSDRALEVPSQSVDRRVQPAIQEEPPTEMSLEMDVEAASESGSGTDNTLAVDLPQKPDSEKDCGLITCYPDTSTPLARTGVVVPENADEETSPVNRTQSDVSFASLLSTPKIARKAVKRRSTNCHAVVLNKNAAEFEKGKSHRAKNVANKLKFCGEGKSKSKNKQKCRQDNGKRPAAFPKEPRVKKQKKHNEETHCSGCKIAESSNEDRALGQDWIQCVCRLWWHESCGEKGGLFDDEFFTCPRCIAKQ